LKKIILIGAGGQCRSLISIINCIGKWRVCGIIDISYKGKKETIIDVPVIGGMEKLSDYNNKEYAIALSIGDNHKREKIKLIIEKKKFEFPNLIHPLSFIDKNIKIGVGNVIGCFGFIGPMVKIGNFNIINTGAKLEHEVAIGDYNHIAPSATVCGRAEIKNKVLLGASCIVLPKIKITSNVTIGANSTLINNAITPDSLLIGTPAVEK